ncbi:hypothetical protein OUZ56_005911 [Daphnia magna]|uniref:Uncharacterized protein n=1 Tax=Daphnia magna TaxID=35525 RepID=A0ABQ9YUA7_9CRUS|nr:hypothetical protein OUZ56_005911 [Daphnia magna]
MIETPGIEWMKDGVYTAIPLPDPDPDPVPLPDPLTSHVMRFHLIATLIDVFHLIVPLDATSTSGICSTIELHVPIKFNR